MSSGVTRVGDTRGGNWGCHPSIFSWKPGDLFCSSLSLSLSLFCFHSGVTPSKVGCHLFYLSVRPCCFSTILCKFAHNFFPWGVTPPGRCHPGRSAPRTPYSDATGHVCLSVCQTITYKRLDVGSLYLRIPYTVYLQGIRAEFVYRPKSHLVKVKVTGAKRSKIPTPTMNFDRR